VNEAKQSKSSLTTDEVKDLLEKKWRETCIARGGNGLDSERGLSRNTIRKYYKAIQLNKEAGQRTTEARKKAAMDLRNYLTAAVMHAACTTGLSWHCIANMDATQFTLKFTNQLQLVSAKGGTDKNPTTRTESDALHLIVKQYFLVSAAGYLAPPLFTLANENISTESFVLLEIPGLGFSFDTLQSGYIAFCNSRRGSDELNRWLFSEYVPGFAKTCKARAPNMDRFYLVIDGEATQLQPLDEGQLQHKFRQENIDLAKGPASCSGVCGNALDCGNLFKAVKGRLGKKAGIGQTQSVNSELEGLLDQQLKSIESLDLSADKRRKISTGLVHLLYQERAVLNFHLLNDGFRKIGMIGDDVQSRIRKTLSCCPNYNIIPNSQIELIYNSFDQLVNKFQQQGELTESDMNDLGIMGECKAPITDKNKLVLSRQRAVLLTKEASLDRRRAYLNSVAAKEFDRESRRRDRGNKAIERENKKRQREMEKADKERNKRMDKELKRSAKRTKINTIYLRVLTRKNDNTREYCEVIKTNAMADV
jgi:hypothetical protein